MKRMKLQYQLNCVDSTKARESDQLATNLMESVNNVYQYPIEITDHLGEAAKRKATSVTEGKFFFKFEE